MGTAASSQDSLADFLEEEKNGHLPVDQGGTDRPTHEEVGPGPGGDRLETEGPNVA